MHIRGALYRPLPNFSIASHSANNNGERGLGGWYQIATLEKWETRKFWPETFGPQPPS